MGMELRVRTTGWSRELAEHARAALRQLDPNDDHFVYEIVTTEDGREYTLEDLEELYNESGNQEPWDELETEQIMLFAENEE